MHFLGTVIALLCLYLVGCDYRDAKRIDAEVKDSPLSEPALTPTPLPQGYTGVSEVVSKKCIECHNPKKKKGEVDLSSYKAILANDPPILVPFKPKSSKILKSVTVLDGKAKMPPNGPTLSLEEYQVFYQWIEQGAKEQPALNDDGGGDSYDGASSFSSSSEQFLD